MFEQIENPIFGQAKIMKSNRIRSEVHVLFTPHLAQLIHFSDICAKLQNMSKLTTLHEFIMDRQADFPFASGELTRLLNDITLTQVHSLKVFTM